MIEQGQEVAAPGYVTDAITDHAVAMLGELAGSCEPFYLEVTYTAPHSPWGPEQHPEELRALYAHTDFPSAPVTEPHPWMNRSHHELMAGFTDRHATLSGYCAALDAWEPSVTVPFIIAGPGVPAGRVESAPTSALALHATLLELAGAPAATTAEASFASLLRGDAAAPHPVVVCDEYGGLRMIRLGAAKLIHRRGGPDELYLLDSDPDEEHNRIGDPALAALRDDLLRRLEGWFAERCDPQRDAWERPVTGWGQDHPIWAPVTDAERYAAG